MAAAPHGLGNIPDSRYAAERRRIDRHRRLSPGLESEFVAARLLDDRTLVRASSCISLLILLSRAIVQAPSGRIHGILLAQFSIAAGFSLVLVWLAWSEAYERHYLTWAEIIVPLRNAIGAADFAISAALGHVELLMVVPMMVIGPFFFTGLRYRAAVLSAIATLVAFAAGAAYTMPHVLALRCDAFMLFAVLVCAIVARHFERSARALFLERYLIQELAQRDALTGARNRRSFDDCLQRIWKEAAESGRGIAVVLIDVDHFKAYNDRYGHLAGDDALRGVARAVQTFVRGRDDIFARYGGEEFAAILQDVDGEQARCIAESMRRAVMELGIEHRASRTANAVTISLGVAAIEPSLARDCRGAVQLADQALYQAKVGGRNNVELKDEADYRLLATGVFRAAPANTMRGETRPERGPLGAWRRVG